MTTYAIGEAGERTGVDVETLRYYEKAGLLARIDRDAGGRRRYTTEDLEWITFVRRLRSTGMPVADIAVYTQRVREGDGTAAERRALLEAHRARVRTAVEELCQALEILDGKIAHYEAAERGVDVDCTTSVVRSVRLTRP